MDNRSTSLPTDSKERKEYSLSRGCYAYFPAALAGVARHSYVKGAKHTGGQLAHNRWLSDDAEDCVERHMMDIRDLEAQFARMDPSIPSRDQREAILDEANALAWRALEVAQKIHERWGGAPLAPAAKLYPPGQEPMPQGIRGTSAADASVPVELRDAVLFTGDKGAVQFDPKAFLKP